MDLKVNHYFFFFNNKVRLQLPQPNERRGYPSPRTAFNPLEQVVTDTGLPPR